MRKVSLWGAGQHAKKNLLPGILSSQTINLIGIYTRNKQTRIELSKIYDLKFYENEYEILNDPEIDTIIVANPTGLHLETSKKIVNSGKNAWSEKSLHISNKNDLSLLKKADKNNLEVRELFMFIYHPQFSKLLSLIHSEVYGKLISLHCKFGIPHLDPDDVRYNSEIGGGALMDIGCYPIAAAHSIFGPKPKRIYSNIVSDNGHEVDTKGHAIFEYGGGEYALLEWGFGMSYGNSATLWFEKAILNIDRFFSKPKDLATEIVVTNSNGISTTMHIPSSNHFQIMFDKYCIKNDHKWIKNQSKLLSIVKSSSFFQKGL